MTFPERPGRPHRLPGHDYRACQDYFVTVVIHDRREILGVVEGSRVLLSPVGQEVWRAWSDLPSRFPFVHLDEFVVMPNHFHGILRFVPTDETLPDSAGTGPGRVHLDLVVRAFKSISAIAVNRVLGRAGTPVWQQGYFEHIVRDEHALERIRAYVTGNPEAWPRDPCNPRRLAARQEGGAERTGP